MAGGFWKPESSTIFREESSRGGDSEEGSSTVVPFNFSNAPLAQQRMLLPIYKHKRQILYSVEKYGVVVIVGETGTGKSTQILQYLYENGWCNNDFQVACTQPRRIAAISLAQRVSQEVGSNNRGVGVGGSVGYSVRFDDKTSERTKIKFLTDGMLLREATLHDPLLSRYSVIMVDEAHERNVNSDAILGLLKKIRRKRKELRIIICSATIDAEAFLDFFIRKPTPTTSTSSTSITTTTTTTTTRKRKRRRRWDNPVDDNDNNNNNKKNDDDDDTSKTAKLSSSLSSVSDGGTIISVDGRQFSVDVLYFKKPTTNYIRSTVETALNIIIRHRREEGKDSDSSSSKSSSSLVVGDILCFLPTAEDIDSAIRIGQDFIDSKDPTLHRAIQFLPLYSSLPYNLQARVFQPPTNERRRRGRGGGGSSSSGEGPRRIILATNIAETSVTVPRITHVVDSGLVKLPYFDPRTDFDRLVVVPTSKASAQQRAGRAGRIQAGQCYRLYTEDFFLKNMDESTPPEMLRTNLTGFILTLKALGVDNILAFDLMDVPSIDALSHGLESLYALGAIDDETNMTKLGLDMSSFPTEPRVSRMLLESLKLGVGREVAAVASTLQVRSLFVSPRGSASQRQQQQLDYDAAISQFADTSGDHVTFANVITDQDQYDFDREDCKERFLNYIALRRVIEIRNQLVRFLKKFGRVGSLSVVSEGEERSKAIRKCVTAGFFFNVAKLNNDGRYYTIRGDRRILVTPSQSSIFHTRGSHSEYIIFCETHDGSRGGIELNAVSAIDPRWLRELAPHYWE